MHAAKSSIRTELHTTSREMATLFLGLGDKMVASMAAACIGTIGNQDLVAMDI